VSVCVAASASAAHSRAFITSTILPPLHLHLQEAKIALIRLFQHQTYELMPGQVPIQLQQNLTLSPRNGLRVRVVRRAA
jgi:hypothetical protein